MILVSRLHKEAETEVLFKDYINGIWSGGPATSWDSFRHSTVGKIAGTILLDEHILNAGVEYKTNSVNNIYNDHEVDKFIYNDTIILYYERIGKGFGRGL